MTRMGLEMKIRVKKKGEVALEAAREGKASLANPADDPRVDDWSRRSKGR